MAANVDQARHALTFGTDEEKVSALRALQGTISGDEPAWFFDVLREHAGSRSNDIRWLSVILMGECIPLHRRTEDVWRWIVDLCGGDDDMKDALATVLLEHLLEEGFDDAIRRIKLRLADRTAGFVELLHRCWRFGQPDAKWRAFRDVVEAAQRPKNV